MYLFLNSKIGMFLVSFFVSALISFIIIYFIRRKRKIIIEENYLWNWFGLSRASFLVVPRSFLHEMPLKWQNKLAKLLYEYEDTFPNRPDIDCVVQARKNGKFTSWPEWIIQYRRTYLNRKKFDNMRKDFL